ncbi:MAG: restriction endonuclease subunit S [Nitrospirae bacterium]|nr:restriction endonuclease subunit S [Nitrospirota bacterium]
MRSDRSRVTSRLWKRVRVKDVAPLVQYGYTASAIQGRDGPRFLRITDIQDGKVIWSSVPSCSISKTDFQKYRLLPGDIVFARTGATTGKSYLIGECPPSVFASYLIRVRLSPEVSPRYLYAYFQSPDYWTQIETGKRGIGQPNVNGQTLGKITFPLAPANEQVQIVAEIEKQFTRLDAGVAALKRVQENLKRYRAAVLKAACEGKLVPTEAELARKEGRPFESGAQLLERILTARREASGKKLRADGRPLKAYTEPKPPDTSNLPPLPKGWTWASVDSLSTKVVDGVHKKPNYVSSGVPFVTVRNLTAGPGVDFKKLNHVTQKDHEEFIKRANPEQGDILISKDGTLGVVRVVKTDTEFSIFVSVALVKPVLYEMNDFLGISLSSPQVQAQMVPKGSGLQHIHLEDLRVDCVPIPPLPEQHRIVAEVERRLSAVEELENLVAANLSRASRLRQSILHQAFSGGLSRG